MATKKTISSVTIYLVGGGEIVLSDTEAVKAVGQYDHNQNIHIIDGYGDDLRIPISAVLTIKVDEGAEEVDMTDSFCAEPTPSSDCLFTIPLTDSETAEIRTYCVTADNLWCGEEDGRYYAAFGIHDALLIEEGAYMATWGGETDTQFEDYGTLSLFGGDIIATNSSGNGKHNVILRFEGTEGGATCEEAQSALLEEIAYFQLSVCLVTEFRVQYGNTNFLSLTSCDVECVKSGSEYYAMATVNGQIPPSKEYSYSYADYDGVTYSGTATSTMQGVLNIRHGNNQSYITLTGANGSTVIRFNNGATYDTCDGAIGAFLAEVGTLTASFVNPK